MLQYRHRAEPTRHPNDDATYNSIHQTGIPVRYSLRVTQPRKITDQSADGRLIED